MVRSLPILFTKGSFLIEAVEKLNEADSWDWQCYMCRKVNGDNVDSCSFCHLSSHPSWLYGTPIEEVPVKMFVGARVALREDLRTFFGVIVAVNVLHREVTVIWIQKEVPRGNTVVLNRTQINRLEILHPSSPMHGIMDTLGYCPECSETFLIQNASLLQDVNGDEKRDLMAQLGALQMQMTECIELKEDFKMIRDSAQILACNARIQVLREEQHAVQKSLQVPTTDCPYCGWPKLNQWNVFEREYGSRKNNQHNRRVASAFRKRKKTRIVKNKAVVQH